MQGSFQIAFIDSAHEMVEALLNLYQGTWYKFTLSVRLSTLDKRFAHTQKIDNDYEYHWLAFANSMKTHYDISRILLGDYTSQNFRWLGSK